MTKGVLNPFAGEYMLDCIRNIMNIGIIVGYPCQSAFVLAYQFYGRHSFEHIIGLNKMSQEDNPAETPVTVYGPRDPLEPCVACNWTLDQHSCASYKSSIKLFYAASTRGVWALGSKFILKERLTTPPNVPTHEAANLRFLNEKASLSVPIPKITQEWTEDNRYFTITSRVEGETLEEAWPKLSEQDKDRIATQVAEGLAELRQLKSDRIEAVGGKPLYGGLFIDGKVGQQPLSSDDELWDTMVKPLTSVDDEKLKILRDNMPQCTPYTFTHADLTNCNIMVKDGNFSGFIDFERSGFFPVWYEFVGCRFGFGKDDKEWKQLLTEKIDRYPNAMNFFMTMKSLRGWPSEEVGKKNFDRLVNNSQECDMYQYW
ncbi:hypothetical protein M426DRAFT_265684 [Hypoxylon sp. CI-4A]|nr:hypothetical protein M426DRAFT_265684 [Hypoxylon sp. CI-4A]